MNQQEQANNRPYQAKTGKIGSGYEIGKPDYLNDDAENNRKPDYLSYKVAINATKSG